MDIRTLRALLETDYKFAAPENEGFGWNQDEQNTPPDKVAESRKACLVIYHQRYLPTDSLHQSDIAQTPDRTHV